MKIKFIEEEIDIRVESIKYELEQEGEKLKNKLRNMKKEIITYEWTNFVWINYLKFVFLIDWVM